MKKTFFQKVHDLILSALGGLIVLFLLLNSRDGDLVLRRGKSWRNLDRMETFISSLSEEERRELLDMMSSSEVVSIGVDAEGCRHFVSED